MAIIFNVQEALRNKAGFNLLQDPFKMLFTNEVEAFEKQSFINKIFTTIKLDSFQEEYRSKTAMDGFEPGADMEPAKISDFEEGYKKVFRAVTWRNSFVVSKQTIEDNQMGQINADAVGFIQSYGRTKEQFAAKMISGALSGSASFGKFTFDCHGMDTTEGTIEGTPQLYFHNAHKSPVHPLDGSGNEITQANKFVVANAAGSAVAGIDLSDDKAYEQIISVIGQMENAMLNFTDYKNNPVPHNPSVILLAEQYKWKNAIIQALAMKYNTSIVDIMEGVTKVGKWTIISTPYLNGLTGFTEADLSFVMIDPVANARDKGIVWVDRKELELSSYYEELNEANIWKGRSRFSAGFGDFRAACYFTGKADLSSAPSDYNAKGLILDDVSLGKSVVVKGTVSTQEVSD